MKTSKKMSHVSHVSWEVMTIIKSSYYYNDKTNRYIKEKLIHITNIQKREDSIIRFLKKIRRQMYLNNDLSLTIKEEDYISLVYLFKLYLSKYKTY